MSTDYYSHTAYPMPGSTASSQLARNEFDAVELGFAKLIQLSTNAGRFVRVNDAGTAQAASTFLTEGPTGISISGTALSGSAVTALLAAPSAIGSMTPNAGTFSTLTVVSTINAVNSQGMVTSQSGGFMFPDGTVQATTASNGSFTSYQALAVLAAIAY